MKARLATAVVLVTALATACVPGEMGDLFGFALDWAVSEEPALQAAAFAAEEVAQETLARESFEQGLRTGDPEPFELAAGLRPLDPTYPAYAAVLWSAAHERDQARINTQEIIDAVKTRYPEAGLEEIQRRSAEAMIDAARDLIVNGRFPHDQVLVDQYCAQITFGYPKLFGDSAEGAFFLALADYSICAGG